MNRIKSGDEVIVVAGKSKGLTGKVLRVIGDKVVVEGCNMIKKHIKANPQKPEIRSGIVALESPIHVSNVAHYNSATKKAEKVGFKYLDNDGVKVKVRYFKSNNEIIDRV